MDTRKIGWSCLLGRLLTGSFVVIPDLIRVRSVGSMGP
jgi:hypothetical protein